MQTNKGHGYIDCCTIVIRSNDYFFVICINFYHYYIRKNATNRENRPGGCLCQLPWFEKKNGFFFKKILKKFHSYFWYDIYYHFFPILNINTKYIEYNNIPFFLSLRCILLRIVNNIRVFVTFHTISCFLGLVFFRCLVIIIANPNIFDGISQLITTVPRG